MNPLRALLEETSARTGFGVHRLVGPERTAQIAHARFAFAWVAQQALAASKPMIANELKRADYTAAVHGIRRAEQLRATDPVFRDITDKLLEWATDLRHD